MTRGYHISAVLALLLCATFVSRGQDTDSLSLARENAASGDSIVVVLTKKKISRKVDGIKFDDMYLDTVKVKKRAVINDYSMIGIQYGCGIGGALWNPSMNQKLRFSPYNVGIMYTRYGKMFGYMSFFGIQAGVFYGVEGYKFKQDKETGYTPNVMGANEAYMKMVEANLLAHCHIDFWKMKLLINLGWFMGYRIDIERISDHEIQYQHEFAPTDHRFDYGIKGGVGFAFVFDPVEIHLQAMYKQSLSSLYDPDYTSPYYYKFAYPMNIIFSAGLHFQLTKRVGRTNSELRQIARDAVNGIDPEKNENKKSVAWR